MTAEIAIMNKLAVALAADSAVTFGGSEGQGEKIYNTANKLFALSHHYPVGIMLYGDAQFTGVPWESVVKTYRKQLGHKSFGTLDEYAEHFIAFLDRRNPLFPRQAQEQGLLGSVASYYTEPIRRDIEKAIQDKITNRGKATEDDVKEVVRRTLKTHNDKLQRLNRLPGMPSGHERRIRQRYKKTIDFARQHVFGKLPLSAYDVRLLNNIAALLYTKELFPSNCSGIVIAGFGERETFPSVVQIKAQGVLLDRLKQKEERRTAIGLDVQAAIVPFAQTEMVATFMEGIDPFYSRAIGSSLGELVKRLCECFAETLDRVPKKSKDACVRKLQQATPQLVEEFLNRLNADKRKRYIDPVISTVGVLPKDELAAMAESLVNLTSFKRRVSMTPETVGGPIDVAVISKGDGFIWIKQKHYFKPELNRHFFAIRGFS